MPQFPRQNTFQVIWLGRSTNDKCEKCFQSLRPLKHSSKAQLPTPITRAQGTSHYKEDLLKKKKWKRGKLLLVVCDTEQK